MSGTWTTSGHELDNDVGVEGGGVCPDSLRHGEGTGVAEGQEKHSRSSLVGAHER